MLHPALQLNDPPCCASSHIDGRWCDADDGATIGVTNPATGELSKH